MLWTGVVLDATRMKEAEKAAAAAEARTREAIIEGLSQGFMLFDAEDRLVIRNSHVLRLHPGLAGIAAPGARYADIVCAELLHGGVGGASLASELAERLRLHAQDHCVFERQLGDDRWILVNEHRTPEGGTVVLHTDISELKIRERRIQHLAHHDALTGLPNRVLFRQRLEEALARAARQDTSVAVLCLDLDHFKHVNDTLGHPAGDALLQAIAERLKGCLRAGDTAARLGGDEFAVILTDLRQPDVATNFAWRLIEIIGQPVDLNGQQVVSGTSIGIAVSGPEDDHPDRLMKNADLALYRSKADERGTFRFFEPEMDARAQARRALEIDLRQAVARDQLALHYQPLVDVYTDEIVGMEALVRWQHPARGLVSPGEFIPLAEETGIIVQLGEWVLRRACADAAGWPGSVRVAVNLSPAQFRNRDLAQVVADILAETGLPPQRLELEITESLLLRDTEANLAVLHRLKDLGIRISMDDFGTGYSSLGNLRSFPFDKIKIDRSFVSDLERSPDSAAIVRAVLSLGRSLGMATTAEGVETRDQLAYLRAEGCAEVQGFYYSEPQPAAQVAAMLTEGARPRGPQLRPAAGKPGRGDRGTQTPRG